MHYQNVSLERIGLPGLPIFAPRGLVRAFWLSRVDAYLGGQRLPLESFRSKAPPENMCMADICWKDVTIMPMAPNSLSLTKGRAMLNAQILGDWKANRPYTGARLVCLALAFPLALSAGCATTLREWAENGFMVGPNYCKPAAPTECQWIDFQKDPRVSADEVDTSHWWRALNDPKLNRVIHLAANQNISLRAAGTRILQAQAIRGIAVGNIFPQTQQLLADYTRVQDSKNVANANATTNFDHWGAGFNFAWEIDFWGRFARALEAADAELDASIEDYDDVLVILLSNVATSYVNIRTYQERIRLARENIELQQATYNVAMTRLKAKAVSKIDVYECQDNVARTKAVIETLKIGLRRENNALCVLMGMPPRDLTVEDLVGEGKIPTVPEEVAVGIPAELLRRRPDIRRAERIAAAQSARIGVAESELFPHLSINGTLGWESKNLSDLFTSRSTSGSIGPGLTWSILNYGRLRWAVREQEAFFEELVFNYQNTVLQAAREVEDAIVGFLGSQSQASALREGATAMAEAERLCLLEAKEGGRNYDRLYVVQLEKTQRQDEWARARGDIPLNLIQIYRALGGGWEIRLDCEEESRTAVVVSDEEPEPVPPPKPQRVSSRRR